jgi:hypothetical protein
MSISRQNLSIVIVAFKSEAIIQKCIESIDDTIQIIIIENSNDMEFKRFIEKNITTCNVICQKKIWAWVQEIILVLNMSKQIMY